MEKNIANKYINFNNMLSYDIGLLEELDSIFGNSCKIINLLIKPPTKFYLRVNTLKITRNEYLNILKERGIKFYKDENIDYAIYAQISGPYEIPIYDKKIYVNKYASESIYLGSNLYIPGILKADKIKKGDKVTIFNRNDIPLASGISIIDWEDIYRLKKGLAVIVEDSVYKSPKIRELPGFEEGYIYSQSLPSMWVAELADPKEGSIIIDMNAAPGGKVGNIAQKVGKNSRIIAIDRPSKTNDLTEKMKRLGYDWVEVIGGDSRYATQELNIKEKADLVLIDPPCTNLGVIPKLSDKKSLRDSIILSRYQKQFINEAFKLLKPGGILMYSTCTLTYTENEENIKYALELGFELDEINIKENVIKNDYGIRFSPENDYPGFFISKLIKKKT
ncbi:tRNA/rRNA cytosine-C5-methylase [Caldisphaera lagunensis DSM 15908]|uniref:tRNA (cytosine(72)-C(5))-methyltransferase n=1 Tax=Caldisphaera lagunensis (strain DSM 15908 / JCM 11604 / ANMR 0165 / IC-154) TaxID=1056495 RepID=L0ABB1_CALLD|nr:RsmB/NOP family class I SAM-dependent RNA methyltransferase [Caldisphaera lagunensis]AFZ70340.1 tRNA/rRNA cytosine-C5-methylase [Caldisphaera lagunensis DSM 15908]